jgi:hypothetical protein
MSYGGGERVEKRQNYNLLTWIHGLVASNTLLLGFSRITTMPYSTTSTQDTTITQSDVHDHFLAFLQLSIHCILP